MPKIEIDRDVLMRILCLAEDGLHEFGGPEEDEERFQRDLDDASALCGFSFAPDEDRWGVPQTLHEAVTERES